MIIRSFSDDTITSYDNINQAEADQSKSGREKVDDFKIPPISTVQSNDEPYQSTSDFMDIVIEEEEFGDVFTDLDLSDDDDDNSSDDSNN